MNLKQNARGIAVRLLCVAILATSAGACVKSQTTPPTPALHVAASPTLAEVARRCAKQDSIKLPVGCQTTSSDGALSMVIQYGNGQQVEAYSERVAAYLGAPFCSASRGSGRRATVYSTVGGVAAAAFDCDLQSVTPWVRIQPTRANRGVNEAVEDCRAIQNDRRTRVQCDTRSVSGVPTMFIGFETAGDTEQNIAPVLSHVAAPFCDGANRAQQAALVYVAFEATQRARGYNCQTGHWTDWFSLENTRASASRTAL